MEQSSFERWQGSSEHCGITLESQIGANVDDRNPLPQCVIIGAAHLITRFCVLVIWDDKSKKLVLSWQLNTNEETSGKLEEQCSA